jgi:hypothetical protein
MQEIVELKFTVSKIDSVTTKAKVLGLVFCEMVLSKKAEEVVTDRLIVSGEGVRVLDTKQ